MKSSLFLFVVLLSLAGCFSEGSKADPGRILEAHNGDHSYTVVYVNQGRESHRSVHQALLKRAAEVTVSHGYRYFIVDAEDKVYVSTSGGALPADNGYFPDNLYEEMIIQKDFDRNSRNPAAPAQLYPGYQIVFHFSEQPTEGKSMDACHFIPCSK